jgi:hypothetical protein
VSEPDYPFEGAYGALIEALPGWGVDLNDGIDLWNQRGDPHHVSGFVYTDKGVGGWVVNVGSRLFEQSTRDYDGNTRADIDAIVTDVLAALRRAEKESAQRAAVRVPNGGALWPSY